MGKKPQPQPDTGLEELRRKEEQDRKKLEQERIDQERARFGGSGGAGGAGGGGSLLGPDQKKQSQLGG